MMRIEPTKDFSALAHEPLARAQESFAVWRLVYGSDNGSTDHIDLFYFGMLPTNAVCARGFLWAEPMPAVARMTRAELRRALKLWLEFAAANPWTFMAYCDQGS